MSRSFSARQKIIMYESQNGRCAICNERFEFEDMHGDHIMPWSKGGPTDLPNGQMLCVQCNLKKGIKMILQPWDDSKDRKWQTEAFQKWLDRGFIKRRFNCVAFPGSGKTFLGLKVAHYLFSIGQINRIVIVVPTEHLKTQWANTASKIGIDLDCSFSFGGSPFRTEFESNDFHGISITYALLPSNADRLLKQCLDSNTLAIFDENHHLGSDLSWGKAAEYGFSHARYHLGLSGTLFRIDEDRIPFTEYNDKGELIPDFYYGYEEALRDGELREVYFPSISSKSSWYYDGQFHEHDDPSKLSKSDAARWLNSTISTKGEWLESAIKEANEKLFSLREDDPFAGGMVICKDISEANRTQKLIKDITGHDAVVVHNENPNASILIDEFRRSSDPWIVSVKMISEGVDIPRLRVGVYATNITSQLFFLQVLGRFIRMIKGDIDNSDAYFYMTSHPEHVTYAKSIMEAIRHNVKEEEEELIKKWREKDSSMFGPQKLFEPQYSIPLDTTVYYREEIVPQSAISLAQELIVKNGVKWDSHKLATMLMEAGIKFSTRADGETNGSNQKVDILIDRKERKGSMITKSVRGLCLEIDSTNPPFAFVQEEIRKVCGIPKKEKGSRKLSSRATMDQLNLYHDIVMAWKEHLVRSKDGPFDIERYICERNNQVLKEQ